MNWTLASIKEAARNKLQDNYWKTVFVTLLIMFISIGSVFSAVADSIQQMPGVVRDIYANMTRANHEVQIQLIALMITLTVGYLLIDILAKVLISIFIKNPVEVGARLFLKKNVREDDKGTIADIAYAFDHSYLYHVKIMLVVNLITFFWYCIFIVPGVIKQYQYRMVPYILSEKADLSVKEAMKISMDMMDGNKMKAFLLDLSFIPWHIAGVLSFGILEIFYVSPYKALTDAFLFTELKKEYLHKKEMQ